MKRRNFNDGYYIGSTVGCGFTLTAVDGEGMPGDNRSGTGLNALAYSSLCDAITGDIASRRRFQHRARKAMKARFDRTGMI